MTATYATTIELARYMNILQNVPDLDSTGTARSQENLGTGNGTATLFYTDNAYVLDNTYTFYYGSTQGASTALTEDTHYTFAIDNGTLTLTSTGVSTVGTANSIFGQYDHAAKMRFTNTYMQDALDRAQVEIDRRTNTHFSNGTVATPDYIHTTNEAQKGKGGYLKDYYSDKYPMVNVQTELTTTAITTATTIYVSGTTGFPTAGTLSIETDSVTYTGKTSTAFTGVTAISSAHDNGKEVYSWVVEVSTTVTGNTPTFDVKQLGTDYDIDWETGKVHLYKDDLSTLSVLDARMPQYEVPNRFRISYLSGWTAIPDDIQRCTLMIASRDLMHAAVRKATMDGNDNFTPTMIEVDKEWIDNIIESYTSYKITNT